MSSYAVKESILNYVSTNFSEIQSIEINEEREKRDLPDAAKFLTLAFVVADEEQIGMPDCYREEGRFLVTLVAKKPLNDLSPMFQEIETYRNGFRGKREGSITFESVGTPKFNDNESLKINGPYFSISFYVDYFKDFKGA